MSEILRIEKFMTHSPHTINSRVPLKTAKQIMHQYGIRHLPVQVGGQLVGVLTERDLLLASTIDVEDKLLVEDAMTPEPYVVVAKAAIGEVVEKMDCAADIVDFGTNPTVFSGCFVRLNL